jgi:hypothetical protein
MVLIERSGVCALRDYICAYISGGCDEGLWEYAAY